MQPSHVSFDDFSNNEMMLAAVVVRELEIIGEAAGKLSKNFKSEHPEIPWADIVGMRNRLIHEYFGVDVKLVWQTSQKNVPELKEKLLAIDSAKENRLL